MNLALRFILELAALVFSGLWAWKMHEGLMKYVLVIGLPLILIVAWGVFNVPNDPSRSGAAPVVVSGWIRLLLELGVFSVATWCIYQLGYTKFCYSFAAIVLIHYGISWERISWLLKQ